MRTTIWEVEQGSVSQGKPLFSSLAHRARELSGERPPFRAEAFARAEALAVQHDKKAGRTRVTLQHYRKRCSGQSTMASACLRPTISCSALLCALLVPHWLHASCRALYELHSPLHCYGTLLAGPSTTCHCTLAPLCTSRPAARAPLGLSGRLVVTLPEGQWGVSQRPSALRAAHALSCRGILRAGCAPPNDFALVTSASRCYLQPAAPSGRCPVCVAV